MVTFADIISIAESLDWVVTNLEEAGFAVDDDATELEFSKYSPAGEDFSFTVGSDSPSVMIKEIRDYGYDFDTEEHIRMWINADTSGIPDIKTLVDDADEIKNMIKDLADKLRDRCS